jgi:arylsulfatase A-like enzyme
MHKPAGPFRGGKYSLFQGGTRVPFIVRWKGTIKPGVSEAMVSQVDILGSMSKLLGQSVEEKLDSKDLLSVLLGKGDKGRESLVIEGIGNLALVTKDWIMIPPSAGATYSNKTAIESGRFPEYQLYHLTEDIGEVINLAEKEPSRIASMRAELERIKKDPSK